MIRNRIVALGSAASLWLALPTAAKAALGESVDTVEADRAALHGRAVAKIARKNFTVHEVQAGSTLVREYVSPSGVVFAVAWNGLSQPDLQPLLGAYHAEYADARRKALVHAGRRHQTLESDHVIVETWGRMRDLHGRAYVAALVPPGIDLHDIQ